MTARMTRLHLVEIDRAAAQIAVKGNRYPDELEKSAGC